MQKVPYNYSEFSIRKWGLDVGQSTLHLWPIEAAFIRTLSNITRRGIRVDLPLCGEMHTQAQSVMDSITASLGFKPSEPSSLGPFLLDGLKLPVVAMTPGGKPSFNKAAMQEYDMMLEARAVQLENDPWSSDEEKSQCEAAKKVLVFRGWQKADSACYVSYRNLVSPDGRIRPNYKLHGTVTGRLSCEKPNLQQIPRKTDKPWNGNVKKCFIPEDENWELWGFDYKTLEFRLAALYAGERLLIERVNAGEDLHQVMADRIGITRHEAKTLNFAVLYGAGDAKIGWMLKKSPADAEEILKTFHNEFPGFKRVMRAATNKAKKQSYVTYWSGRRKHYNTRWNWDEHHKAFNALCQGGGAELVKQSMVNLMPLEDERSCRMVLQVHDEVVFEIRKDRVEDMIPKITSVMSDWNFPVKFDVDSHLWGE